MTDIQMIALNKLDRDPKNVRKNYRADGVAELAASIKAEGLLQNIVVRPGEKRGRYFVTAGGRRFAALISHLSARHRHCPSVNYNDYAWRRRTFRTCSGWST